MHTDGLPWESIELADHFMISSDQPFFESNQPRPLKLADEPLGLDREPLGRLMTTLLSFSRLGREPRKSHE